MLIFKQTDIPSGAVVKFDGMGQVQDQFRLSPKFRASTMHYAGSQNMFVDILFQNMLILSEFPCDLARYIPIDFAQNDLTINVATITQTLRITIYNRSPMPGNFYMAWNGEFSHEDHLRRRPVSWPKLMGR